MMIFAPLIINSFTPRHLLRLYRSCAGVFWVFSAGSFSWPMGFVMLAKGKGKLFFITEVFVCFASGGWYSFFIRIWGLDGAGIAFMTLYIFYTGLMLLVMRRLVGATWDRHTCKLIILSATTMMVLILNCTLNNNLIAAWTINIAMLCIICWLCLQQLFSTSRLTLKILLDKFRDRK